MRAAILVLCLIIPLGAAGITIDEAVKMALSDSEAVRMIYASGQAMKSAGDQAVTFAKPQLSIGAGYVEMGDNRPEIPIAALNPPDRHFSAELTASQVLFAGGRISRSFDLRQSLYRQAELNERSGRRKIVKQVRDTFNAVLYQQAALAINLDRLTQRQDELQDARDLREVGMATALDVRQAQLNMNFVQDQKIAGETTLQEAIITFNLAIGRSGDQELLIPAGRLEDFPDTTHIINLLIQKLEQQELLDLTLRAEQVQAAETEWKIAQGDYYPTLSAFSTADSNGEKFNNMHESWKIGVKLNWNFYTGGLVQSKTTQSRTRLNHAAESLEQTRKQLSGEIELIKLNLSALSQRIQMQHEVVSLSRENYLDARGHYRAGAITLTQLGEFHLNDSEAKFVLISLYFAQHQMLTRALALLAE